MRIKQLKQRRASLVAAADANLKASRDAGDRGLTAEEKAKAKELQASIDSIDEDIALEERALANRAGQSEEDAGSGRDLALTTSVEEAAAKDPMKGFKSHRDFLCAVIDDGRGVRKDKRLRLVTPPRQATVGSDEQSIANNAYGGFLVPEGMAAGVLTVNPDSDPFAGVTPFPMEVPTVRIDARVDKNHSSSVSGGLTVTRRPETVAGTASRMEFEKVSMHATSLFGLAYASEELLAFSPVSFAAILAAGFKDEFMSKGVDETINGSGAGEPEGILNSPALVSVAKETGQAAATIVYNNIIKMVARLWGPGVWIANRDTLPQISILAREIGTMGWPIYQDGNAGKPATLLGMPIFFSEYPKTLGTKGDLLLVNASQILDGRLQPMQSAESIHVRFVEHEKAFKFWLMNDRRCWWRSALTPKNSSDTLSPLVALNTRV